jgi:hypothetical protein
MHRSTVLRCLYASLLKPGGRAPASAAPSQAVADLVRRLRDDRADLSAAQVTADRAG